MKKVAIFVEGQTELIFVREYLLRKFEYTNIEIECYTLFVDSKLHPTEYAYQSAEVKIYFQIINVGNDNALLSRILKREQFLWNQGFTQIIGLRDMYAKAYREVNPTKGEINLSVNQQFISSAQETIRERAVQPEKIAFHFAIMETESWILAIPDCFIHVHPALSEAFILEQTGYNLQLTDPEIAFFHPAKIVNEIYEIVGESYSKSKGDIYSLLANVSKETFQELIESNKCLSFRHFSSSI